MIESCSWHEQVPQGTSIRPEDVIVSAFTALRLIAVSLSKLAFPICTGLLNAGPLYVDGDDEDVRLTKRILGYWSSRQL